MVGESSERSRSSPTGFATMLALLATLLVLPLALAQRADAYIYVASGTIGRANLDGTSLNWNFFDTDDAMGVAVDARHVYWRVYSGSIGRANLDGTHVDRAFISGASRGVIWDLTVDAGHIYWTEETGIGRANLDGTDVDPDFISGVRASDVAVDAGHVYWLGAPPPTTSVGPGYPVPIYPPSSMGRARLNGTEVEPSFIGDLTGYNNHSLAVDADHIYWEHSAASRQGDIYDSRIGRADIDGTDVDEHFVELGDRAARDLTVDALADTRPPDTTITKGAPRKTETAKIKFRFESSEPNSTFECRLDGRRYKPCSSPKQVEHLDTGKHKFQVRAADPAGNVDPSAAKDKFKVVRK